MNVHIYVEGGGASNALRTKCRQGFRRFFEKAGCQGQMPSITACGSRADAYDSFRTAIQLADVTDFPLLLVDSETAVVQPLSSWAHLKARDGWDKPAGAREDHAHLMVYCMEAWFLADRTQLASFFGQGFKANALPGNTHVEQIDKQQIMSSLKAATRQTKTKGEYDKGKHSFDLLSRIDPGEVGKVAPHAKRLIDTVKQKSN